MFIYVTKSQLQCKMISSKRDVRVCSLLCISQVCQRWKCYSCEMSQKSLIQKRSERFRGMSCCRVWRWIGRDKLLSKCIVDVPHHHLYPLRAQITQSVRFINAIDWGKFGPTFLLLKAFFALSIVKFFLFLIHFRSLWRSTQILTFDIKLKLNIQWCYKLDCYVKRHKLF